VSRSRSTAEPDLAALLRLLLRRRLRPGLPDPDFHPAAPDLPAMLDRCDAALVIGDRALFAARDPELRGSDLVRPRSRSGVGRADRDCRSSSPSGPGRRARTLPRSSRRSRISLEEGLGRIEDIAREESEGDPAREALVRGYLTRAIRYRLGTRRSAD
jgi:predicted solute-binding protein